MRYSTIILAVILLGSLPALAATPSNEHIEIVEQGKARGEVRRYAEEARKHEAEGKLQDAASSFLTASILSRTSGDYQKAIEYGQKAIELSRSGPQDVQAKSLLQTARAYFRVGNEKQAIALAEESVQFSGRHRFRGIEANANELIGSIYRRSDPQNSMLYLRKAFDYYDGILAEASGPEVSMTRGAKAAKQVFRTPGHIRNFIDIAASLGDALTEAGQYEAAAEVLGKAARFSEDYPLKTAMLQIARGNLDARTGKRQEALDQHQKACAMARKLDVPHLVMRACRRTGNDLEHLGRREESIAYYEQAVRAIEDQRSRIQSEEMRSGYFEQMIGTYDDITNALARLGRGEEAFAYSERARARTFLDLLAGKSDLSRGKATSLIAEERELKRRMSMVQLKLDETGDLAVKDEIDAIKREYEDFLKRLKNEDPEHASLLTAEPLSVKSVQEMLGPNQALIEFHVLKGRTIRWAIRKDGVANLGIPEGHDGLNGRLLGIRAAIEKIGPLAELQQELRELYALLFKDAQFRPGEEVIIVAHDILHYLPFAALVSGSGRYLIQDHALSYLSSASLLQFTRAKSRKVDGQAVAFGNPDLGNPAYNLRYAEREAREIKLMFPRSAVFLRQNATKTRVRELMNSYSVIHFAVHAELNEQDPQQTALLFSTDSVNEGNLSVAEVFGMTLSSSLVVLSACETELGPVSRGDEMIGLTRAFIYAGTPSVITTLWSVNDKTAFLLMAEFYRNVYSMRKLDALRQAQVRLIETYPHPFYWAAYMLTGDTE